MSTFNYPALAKVAVRLLTQFGMPHNYRRTVTGEFDPSTGSAPETITLLPTTAVIFDVTNDMVDGTLILAGDKIGYAIPAVRPMQGDDFDVAPDVWWKITSTTETNPAETPVLQEFTIRVR